VTVALRRVTLLGCGTSTGVPVVGCTCPVCTSGDPRNARLRPGARLDFDDAVVLVDTPVDLRQQALRYGLPRLDAVLFTHAHADHVFGLDEVRVFNFRQGTAMPCYGSAATLAALRRVFAYAFEDGQEGGGRPRLELVAVDGPFDLHGERVVPVPVLHGSLPVLGYRLGRFAYVTDVSQVPEESFALLAGVDTLVLGALRWRPHSTHFSIPEAVVAAARIGARRTVLTHLAHDVDAADSRVAELPPGVELGVDGLVLELEGGA
jgi:phosphoribosyl 1,2-cyclic phosphate phosphodiesterase